MIGFISTISDSNWDLCLCSLLFTEDAKHLFAHLCLIRTDTGNCMIACSSVLSIKYIIVILYQLFFTLLSRSFINYLEHCYYPFCLILCNPFEPHIMLVYVHHFCEKPLWKGLFSIVAKEQL